MSFFADLETAPNDPILGLNADFQQDSRSEKVNLGVGAYQDEKGSPKVLNAVREAERIILEKKLPKSYPPIEGNRAFSKQIAQLMFGQEFRHPHFAAQTLGATGALRIGGELIKKFVCGKIYLSNPSWPNHRAIFKRCGLEIGNYPYYNPETRSLDFKALCEAIQKMPEGATVLFQASCHNPTGVDPDREQWKEISSLVKNRRLLPFFDFPYQGFGQDLESDAFAVRQFLSDGHEMLIAYSCSKNFGLYGERVGSLTAIAADEETAKRCGSQIKQLIRGSYSVPPLHGARIVETILQFPSLKEMWLKELEEMRSRLEGMREELVSALSRKRGNGDFDFLINQKGMFSFSGLHNSQVDKLKNEKGIYLPGNGRMNVAGLNRSNLEYVAGAMLTVFDQ